MMEKQKSRSDCDTSASINQEMEQRMNGFELLVHDVQHCRLCPRMEGRARVLGYGNGSLDAATLFIAEAPGRLGAERLGIPLSGDQTGRNFEMLLTRAGLDRQTIFVTNAILCNPQNMRGNNTTPTTSEIEHCSAHLARTIELLHPRFVVTLGTVALNAIRAIEDHNLKLSQHVGQPQIWHSCWLIPLYHPGPRARVHRPVEAQQQDFDCLGDFIRNHMVFSPLHTN
jgi:uracil-DNA glycosylase family 4